MKLEEREVVEVILLFSLWLDVELRNIDEICVCEAIGVTDVEWRGIDEICVCEAIGDTETWPLVRVSTMDVDFTEWRKKVWQTFCKLYIILRMQCHIIMNDPLYDFKFYLIWCK